MIWILLRAKHPQQAQWASGRHPSLYQSYMFDRSQVIIRTMIETCEDQREMGLPNAFDWYKAYRE